jgi:protein-S-isoprenylcysteine O-methyltransferase Ste14
MGLFSSIYTAGGSSTTQRITFNVAHAIVIGVNAWLLLGGGIETVGGWFGATWAPGNATRRALLFTCSLIYFGRIVLTTSVLLHRKFAWSEAITVAVWVCIIHWGFALLGGTVAQSIGLLDVAGAALFLVGSYLNTTSEWQRTRWRRDPENAGKLFTGGLYRLAMHVNYFGDIVLFTGYAMITHRPWAGIVPVLMFANFALFFVPKLDQHLAQKYGDQFDDFARTRRRLFPFVY